MCPVKTRHILLVTKNCPSCAEAKRRFASKYFGTGEIIDAGSHEGQRLVTKHQVAFVPVELEDEYEPDAHELLKQSKIVVITKESHPEYYKEILRISGKLGGVYEPETGRIIVLDRVTDTALHEIGHKLQYSGKVPPDVWRTFKEEFKNLKYTEKFKQLYGEQDYSEVWADIFAKVAKGKDVTAFPQTTWGIKRLLS